MAEEERSFIVRMSEGQLMMVRDSLHQSRLACDETDCFYCCEFGELERRIGVALKSLA